MSHVNESCHTHSLTQVTDTVMSFAVRPSYSHVLLVSLSLLSLLSTGRQLWKSQQCWHGHGSLSEGYRNDVGCCQIWRASLSNFIDMNETFVIGSLRFYPCVMDINNFFFFPWDMWNRNDTYARHACDMGRHSWYEKFTQNMRETLQTYVCPNGSCSFCCVWGQHTADPSWCSRNMGCTIRNYILLFCDSCNPVPGKALAHALRLPHWRRWKGAVSHVKESCDMWMSHVTYVYTYTHIYMYTHMHICVYRHKCIHLYVYLHFLCMNEGGVCIDIHVRIYLCIYIFYISVRHITYKWVTPCMNTSRHIWTSHVTYEQVTSRMNKSRHIWTSHVTYEQVTSHMNKSRHIWTSHVTYE